VQIIKNIRYAHDGKIAFDYKGNTIKIREPIDIILVGIDESLAAKWIFKHYGYLLHHL
jgi:hypothetical protein